MKGHRHSQHGWCIRISTQLELIFQTDKTIELCRSAALPHCTDQGRSGSFVSA
jgi:hypothetical protein